MRSKNFDESIGMTDFDYATRKASSLDIAKPLQLRKIAIDGRAPQTYLAAMTTRDTIINKLREAFIPESLEVADESHLHEGHAGHKPGGETHFRVYIVSPAFKGKSRIERHRMINATLSSELATSVHALAIHAQAPGESN
jgi:BolA family transcriptional regulator, general stress-responsive regulator